MGPGAGREPGLGAAGASGSDDGAPGVATGRIGWSGASGAEVLVFGDWRAAGLSCAGFSSGLGAMVSRIFRTTGASSVDDGPRTYSPMSLSFPRSSLLVIPISFAISWTRGLATTLLLGAARVSRATA